MGQLIVDDTGNSSFVDDLGNQCFVDDLGDFTLCPNTNPPPMSSQGGRHKSGGAIYKIVNPPGFG